ncbi:hypothetical protein [Streptomyces collinus]|uniref:hypothetical protein n=1 Tax=Streptomyces collinus TaxID=42684 RepID=UPI0036933860
MVTEPLHPTSPVDELLDRISRLRTDADLVDGYARRLSEIASALAGCAAAPDGTSDTLERRAAACGTAATQLRTAADALLEHVRAVG